MPEDMSEYKECFLTGTAAEVSPVSEIGPYKFQVGDITKQLIDDYQIAVHPKQIVSMISSIDLWHHHLLF